MGISQLGKQGCHRTVGAAMECLKLLGSLWDQLARVGAASAEDGEDAGDNATREASAPGPCERVKAGVAEVMVRMDSARTSHGYNQPQEAASCNMALPRLRRPRGKGRASARRARQPLPGF